MSAASRTAPERGVGVLTTSRTSPSAIASRIGRSPISSSGAAPSFAIGSTPEPGLAQRRARPGGRREPVAGAAERLASGIEPPLVAVGDRQQRERRLALARAAAGTSDAPVSALAIATRGSSAIPMTSPVDCMNGPTDGSTPLSFAVENAGRLDRDERRRRPQPGLPAEVRERRARAPIRTASSTIGTPVTLDRNGTVRLARGLTSIRYTPSSRTMNWALTRPLAPSARQIRSIVCDDQV